MACFLLLLLHVCTKFLAKTTAQETVKILVENCPKRTPGSAITLHFAEYDSRTEYMSDGVHPRLLIPLEMRINNSNVVIKFLQRQAMFWGGKNSLANEGSVRQIRFRMRVRPWWQFEW